MRARRLLGAALGAAALACAPAPALAQSNGIDTLRAVVDGRRVHMIAMGSSRPNVPTIVFEAGFGGTSRTWVPLMRELADSFRVIAYDRAGLGASPRTNRPRTSRAIATELREALRSVNAAPPYVLVAHSAGGLHARVFAGMFPQEVIGMVLVDPAPEDFYARAERDEPREYAHQDSIDRLSMARASAGLRAEDAAYEGWLREAREAEGKYDVPVIVLSSRRRDLGVLGPIWTDEHRRYAAAGKRREYRLVEDAGHDIHRERLDVVVEAVLEVVRGR